MKLKDYVSMHKEWNTHMQGDSVNEREFSEKGSTLPVQEAGRYHRSEYQGDDPRAQAIDQAIALLDDLQYDSLEDDVSSYADDAVRALSKAIEELEYKRNQVGNDPDADAERKIGSMRDPGGAPMRETNKPPINEAEFVGHHAEIDGKMYVDSNFLNSVRKIRDTFPSSLESMGFGEFYLQTPKGRIDFDRSRGKQFEGMVGRSHQLYANPPELADELIDAMEQAGASETPQPSEESPLRHAGVEGAKSMSEGGMSDLHIEIQDALSEIMEQYGVRLEDILGVVGDMQEDAKLDANPNDSAEGFPPGGQYRTNPEAITEEGADCVKDYRAGGLSYAEYKRCLEEEEERYEEGADHKLTKEEFLKIVHEELGSEINKETKEESFYTTDALRKMVREEVGGLIGEYKKSLDEGDEGEGNFITFSDGYKFKEVSKSFAASNWDKQEVFGIDISSESESLIQSPDDLNQPWDAFGIEAGGSLEEADEGGPGVHDIFNMPEPQAPESTGNPKEDAIREIVASESMGRVEGVKLDLYSASAIVKVLDGVSPENKEKYLQLSVDKMAQLAFKMMS